MDTSEFDKEFQKITSEMIRIAFEYIHFNKSEIDKVYVFGSLEDNTLVYKMFYMINGIIVTANNASNATKLLKDLNYEREGALLDLGNSKLVELEMLFKKFTRDVPTLIKMIYQPKNGKFDCKLSYDLQYSYAPSRSYVHVYREWISEEKKESQA